MQVVVSPVPVLQSDAEHRASPTRADAWRFLALGVRVDRQAVSPEVTQVEAALAPR
jgi:hypothetical protein